jgi:hypothetical protein
VEGGVELDLELELLVEVWVVLVSAAAFSAFLGILPNGQVEVVVEIGWHVQGIVHWVVRLIEVEGGDGGEGGGGG